MVVSDDDLHYHCSKTFNSTFNCLTQAKTNSLHNVPYSGNEVYYNGGANAVPAISSNFPATDNCMVNEQTIPDSLFEEIVHLNEQMNAVDLRELAANPSEQRLPKQESQWKRTLKVQISHSKRLTLPSPKKRTCRAMKDVKGNANTGLSKKKQKKVTSFAADKEESNAAIYGQGSSSYSSEDDSNTSQEINGGTSSSSKGSSAALNTNGKARARWGSATKPQSLYARKRRERINERLRILQNLVPNGTKVDISTMLEEAVEYVKFLQLQIKLLSSDDLWIYTPIAYNGMDIGLDSKISALQ